MTRYVVDAPALIQLAAEGVRIRAGDELLAPTLIRSQVLSRLHEQVARGELAPGAAQERLAAIGRIRIRLLGDALLRRVAWRVADQLGAASTYDAEYVALTQLQADILVAADPDLAAAARGLVRVGSVGDLRG